MSEPGRQAPRAKPWQNPIKGRRYLVDPNYYRLGYHLAAQMLNADLATSEHKAVTYVPGYGKGLPVTSAGPLPHDAHSAAVRVIAQADVMLAWFRAREQRPWRLLHLWWWLHRGRGRLTHFERRLRAFLKDTVRPASVLVAAAAAREAGDTADTLVAPILEQGRRGTLTYRVYYNLACYEAGVPGATQETLNFLAQAFRLAGNPTRRDRLVASAAADPSFAEIRRRPEFLAGFKEVTQGFAMPHAFRPEPKTSWRARFARWARRGARARPGP